MSIVVNLNWMVDFRDEEIIDVVLVGGPKDGELTQATRDRRWDPSPNGLMCLHLSMGGSNLENDDSTSSWYGPIKRDGDRWVRHHVSTKPVERAGST